MSEVLYHINRAIETWPTSYPRRAGMLIPKKGLSARPLNTMGTFYDDTHQTALKPHPSRTRCRGYRCCQAQGGDIKEAMSTLWYHAHRIDHTAE